MNGQAIFFSEDELDLIARSIGFNLSRVRDMGMHSNYKVGYEFEVRSTISDMNSILAKLPKPKDSKLDFLF